MNDFLLPTLGALMGGILTDLFIRNWFNIQNQQRLLRNLKGDLEYNLSVNQEVKRVFKEYMINIAHYVYTTDGIREFVYQKVFNTNYDSYNKLLKLLILLESSNKLLQASLFRSDGGRHVIIENSIKSNTNQIEQILLELLNK